MTKVNAYSLFVRDEFNRRQRAGQNPIFNNLFRELDSQWRNAPDDVKQSYKERAKNGGDPSFKPNYKQKNNTQSQNPATNGLDDRRFNDHSQASTSSGRHKNYSPSHGHDLKRDSIDSKLDEKPKRDILDSAILESERGQKRSHDVVTQESELEIIAKKAKLGFSVPNWKNILKSSQPNADRYAQHWLLKIRGLCETLVSNHERRLLAIPMCTISTNVLCRHTKEGKDIYVPIEISINAYSIQKGRLGQPFHCIIDAGPVPSGMVNQTRDHTENTHKITNPSRGKYPDEARNDYLRIYKEMLKYTKGSERTILVPDERDMEQVKGCLEWIYEKAAYLDPDISRVTVWTILPMVEYVAAAYNFVHLRMLHNEKPVLTLHYAIRIRQENSTWDYDESYMCPYHQHKDHQTKWCAKSCATRAILAVEDILDNLAKNYIAVTNPQNSLTFDAQQPVSGTQVSIIR